MSQSTNSPRRYPEFDHMLEMLTAAATNPRDKAFISMLGTTGMGISEAIQLKTTGINFKRGSLTILQLRERLESKCTCCGGVLGRKHVFCPACGSKADRETSQKVEHRRQRTIPVAPETLRLLKEYLKWRRQFLYQGQLVFPFSRQRGWQIIEKLGRRAGIEGSHPHSLRHLLTATWVSRALDTNILQILLGYANTEYTLEHVDPDFEQLKSEYEKLWRSKEDTAPGDRERSNAAR